MTITVYDVNKDVKYLFIADGPKNALEKMAYMLNVQNQDLELECLPMHPLRSGQRHI